MKFLKFVVSVLIIIALVFILPKITDIHIGFGGGNGEGVFGKTGLNQDANMKDDSSLTCRILIEGYDIIWNDQQVGLKDIESEIQVIKEEYDVVELFDNMANLKTYNDVYTLLDKAGIKVIKMTTD